MSVPELPTPVCAEHLGALHRYACLLTGGDPAATSAALDLTLERAAARSGDIRCPRRSARWLFAEVRVQCRRVAQRGRGAAALVPEGSAAAFLGLPEPERAALALFYVGPFRRLELADTLGVRPDELGPLLQHARTRLAAASPAPEETADLAAAPPPDGALAVG